MLVLSRRPGEDIVIGDDILIRVLSIDRNSVRLGITAPADVPIMRRELLAGREPDNAAELTELLGDKESPL